MYYYYSKPSVFSYLLDYPYYTSLYDSWPYEKVISTSYKYEPISKYTYSSRKIYPYEYDYSYYWPKYDYFKGELEWENHKRRMDELDKYYPTKFINPRTYIPRYDYRPRIEYKTTTITPLRSTIQRTYYPLYTYTPGLRSGSEEKPDYTTLLSPYTKGGFSKSRLIDFLYPNYYLPRYRYLRDPYWWDHPEIRPYRNPYIPRTYITPVTRSYLWTSSSYPYRSYLTYFFYT